MRIKVDPVLCSVPLTGRFFQSRTNGVTAVTTLRTRLEVTKKKSGCSHICFLEGLFKKVESSN